MLTNEQVVETTLAWAGRMVPRLYDLVVAQQARIEALASAEDPDLGALEQAFEELANLQSRAVQLLRGKAAVDQIRGAEAETMKQVLDRLAETRRMILEAEAEGE